MLVYKNYLYKWLWDMDGPDGNGLQLGKYG